MSDKHDTIGHLSLIIVLLGFVGSSRTANVLYVAPFAAISHYQMLEPLMLSLANRGHNITVISHYPRKEKMENYTDVDLRGLESSYEIPFKPWNFLDDIMEVFTEGWDNCKAIASSDIIQQFLKNDNKFDLIIIEAFFSDCLLGLVAKYKAPYILYSVMSLPVWNSDWISNPIEFVYRPEILCRIAGEMDFYNKLKNIACQSLFRVLNKFQNEIPTLGMIRDHFHVDIDDIGGLKRNVSLVLVNSFHGLTGVRPFFPNIIEVGGIHLKPAKPLPQKIEKFCTESDGVIVFSMGSIVQARTLSPKIKSEILSAISNLKERVLWKWEEEFPDRPDNLLTVPWLPQSDVLGHPKVKLFISHGGIHGLYEAIYNGVPIIGIPLFGDQMGNLKALEVKGVAVTIEFTHLSGKTLSSAINRVLGNDSFKQNAELLSRIFRDQPQKPLDRAIFWTEYVIRHGGAQHFQSGASQLSWWQLSLVDVLFLCVSFLIALITVFYYSLKILRII